MIAAFLLAALLAATAPPAEIVTEIRVHGNATIPDEKVIALAGVEVDAALEADALDAIARRLRDSGRFDEVEVTKRYRTLDMDRVALVLLVHERPGVTASGNPPSALRRFRSRLLFLPILDVEDGYGATYGARTSTIDALGLGERLSVPLSWGGTRRAAVEADRTFRAGPLTRVFASYGITQRENPYFHVADQRVEVRGRAERRLAQLIVGATAAREDVRFGTAQQPQWTAGMDVTLDTRKDPSYPVNAIVAGVAWDRLHAGDVIDRYRYSVRGFGRVYGQAIVAARVELDTASAPLPPWEQWLLGGTRLRGMPPDTAVGDKRFSWSGELRVPVTSPLKMVRLGVTAFLDGGAVAPHAVPLESVAMERSAGAGVFARLPFVTLNLDVAHSLDGRGTRVHVATGFAF